MTQNNDFDQNVSDSDNSNQSDHIGSFSAYVRRPAPSTSGLSAQFYGENGDDADMITALSLTKFQENNVLVNVFFIKDSNGSLQKNSIDGQYPLICSFNAKIQRPKPSKDGMLAIFFAENGHNADQVNSLGLTKYQDAFVFVEISKVDSKSNKTHSPLSVNPSLINDLEQSSKTLTASERKILEKKAKTQKEAHKLLQLSGFFHNPQVWSALGTPFDYENFILASPCCAPSEIPCNNNVKAFSLPNDLSGSSKYNHIPLCEEHEHSALQGTLPGGSALLKMRRLALIQIWAINTLLQKIGLDEKTNEPDPEKVLAWCYENKLTTLLPPNYMIKQNY